MFTSSGGSASSKSSTGQSVWASILVSNFLQLTEEAEHWGCVRHLLVLHKRQGHSVTVLVAQDNQRKSLLIIYIEQGKFMMAAQAKGYRQVKKEELEASIEDAEDAIENANDKKLREH